MSESEGRFRDSDVLQAVLNSICSVSVNNVFILSLVDGSNL